MLQGLRESLEKIGSTPWGHTCPDLLWQLSKAGKIQECWQLWPIVGGGGNDAVEEDWHWGLNPGTAAGRCFFGGGTTQLGQRRIMDIYFFF